MWIPALAGAMAFSLTLPTAHLTGRDGVIYSNSIHSLLFIIMGGRLWVGAAKGLVRDRRRTATALVLSFFFSLFLLVGSSLETTENFNIMRIGSYPILVFSAIFLLPLLEAVWQWLKRTEETKEGKEQKKGEAQEKGKTHFLRNSLLLLLCWLPVFLAFFPGAFVYDAYEEFVQADTGAYTTHHPLIHVLLLGKSLVFWEKVFGSYNAGIAIYTILQMMVMAAVLSYTIEYLRKNNHCPLREAVILLFYGFFPVIPMYAVCSAKDTYFTVFLLLSIVMLLQLYEQQDRFFEKKGNVFLLLFSATLMLLFRNNGVYAYGVWLLIAGAGFPFGKRKKGEGTWLRIMILLLPLLFSFLLNFSMKELLGAQKGGAQEIMTVPIQQMARVYQYAPETYTKQEKEILYEILPQKELHLYTPRISDLLKSKFNNEAFRSNPVRYLTLWGKIGLRKPLIYLNAWLLTSYGYWYPDGVINVYGGTARHTIVYEDSSYFGFETEPPGVRHSLLPLLEKVYRKISLDLFQQRIPGISLFFSPGFMFWCFSLCMGYYIWNRKNKLVIPFLLPFLVWMTVLLGPTYLVRYVLILWMAAPLFAMGIQTKRQ